MRLKKKNVEFADQLLEEVLRQHPGTRWTNLPFVFRRAAGLGDDDDWPYLALLQRVKRREIAPGSRAAATHEARLRLAFSKLLDRQVEAVVFRTAGGAAALRVGAEHPSTFLAGLFARREREEVLQTCRYLLVTGDLQLGGPLPPDAVSAGLPSWKDARRNPVNTLPPLLERRALAGPLAFARMARLLAAGLSKGITVRILLVPGLHSLSPVPGQDLGEGMKAMVQHRLHALAEEAAFTFDGDDLFSLKSSPALDVAALLILLAAGTGVRGSAIKGARSITDRLTIEVLPPHDARERLFADDLLQTLPARFLFEQSAALDDPGKNAFLWIRIVTERRGPATDRLLELDVTTTQLLWTALVRHDKHAF